MKLPRIVSPMRTGTERLRVGPDQMPHTLLDFWQWALSDVLANTSRGLLAEFLVGLAVGADMTVVREEWATYDLVTPEGVTLEVKSGSFLQAWGQESHSAVQFSIQETRAFNPDTGKYEGERMRQADVYVFALLAHREKTTVDPLDLSQWEFYIAARGALDTAMRHSKKLGLNALPKVASGPHTFHALREAVATAAARPGRC